MTSMDKYGIITFNNKELFAGKVTAENKLEKRVVLMQENKSSADPATMKLLSALKEYQAWLDTLSPEEALKEKERTEAIGRYLYPYLRKKNVE